MDEEETFVWRANEIYESKTIFFKQYGVISSDKKVSIPPYIYIKALYFQYLIYII